MTLSQKLLLFVLQVAINLIWLLDWLSVHTLFYLVSKYKKITLAVFIGALLGLGIYTGAQALRTVVSPKTLVDNEPIQLNANTQDSTFAQVLGSENQILIPVVKESTQSIPPAKPKLSARSVLAKDTVSDTTLFEKNPKLILAPASTTKLMTAMVALESLELGEQLLVPMECTQIESTRIGFPKGAKFKVIDLLYAMLASSGGDAACTLAYGANEESVSDGSYLTNYDNFIAKMNEQAKKLKMKNTYFTNAVGLDGYASSHYSTADDLYILAKEAVKSDTIKEIVKTKTYVINSLDGSFTYSGQNTNKLLWDRENTVGIKTGTTLAAGEVLIYEYKKDNKDIIIIVMGSADRFADTEKILDWVMDNYEWKAE